MLNGSCFTVLNNDQSKSVLLWAKKHGESRILQAEGEVELLQTINLILEKNPEIELIAKFEEPIEMRTFDEVESGS